MVNAELLSIVGPALVAGLMIALTHAPLGIEVLKRGIIFIDLAIAQIAGLGMVIAGLLWHEPSWWQAQGLALACAFLAAYIFRLVERKLPEEQEAIIGCSFVVSASLALLLLADQPHGGEEIQHLLSGQILFVAWQDVLLHAPVYGLILALWFIIPKVRQSAWFYILFAIAITSSVQLVGVYVVFASLILPALAARNPMHQYKTAWGCGIISVLAGIAFSILIDVPAGPVIVLSYVVVAMLCRILRSIIVFS